MSILVVGSVALDSVETPFGKADDALGGSAVYFSVSASYFTPVNLVAVIGDDFPDRHIKLLHKHGVDTSGLQKVAGKTFRWKGHYLHDLNQAQTLDTQLNVFANFSPELPAKYRDSKVVFLANIDPVLQRKVLEQVKKPQLVACDTMNFWIESKRDELIETLGMVDILVINEGEARQLAKEANLVKAAKAIFKWGPKALVIKRGEYGALFFTPKHIFSVPAYPLENVFDPTGAGDTFAGGFMGYLAQCGAKNDRDLRRAMIFGSVMASFNVEDFSLNRLTNLSKPEIRRRFEQFKKLTHFELLK
ncbi:MAG: PfkB family carbohydrate kinase [Elusimicrobiota bacterium]